MTEEKKLARDRGGATDGAKPRHPAFGSMRGLLTIPAGVDLTEPTCPDWDAYAERKYGPDSKLGRLWAQVVERDASARRTGLSHPEFPL